MSIYVEVYTRNGCQPCKATKIYLAKYGIQYRENNIDDDPVAMKDLSDMGVSAVPHVQWGASTGQIGSWTGFRPEKIEDLKFLRDAINAEG